MEAIAEECVSGNLEAVMRLVATGAATAKDVRACNCAPLRRATERGHHLVVKWLVESFDLTLEDVLAREYDIEITFLGEDDDSSELGTVELGILNGEELERMSQDGDSDDEGGLVLSVLQTTSVAGVSNFLYHRGESVLSVASKKGDVALVDWLFRRFSPSIHRHAAGVIADACASGQIALARWVVERFPGDDVCDGKMLLDVACQHFQKEATAWVVEVFQLSREDILSRVKQMCASKEFDFAQWLADRYEFTPDELEDVPEMLPLVKRAV
jgi:hypothetical protein